MSDWDRITEQLTAELRYMAGTSSYGFLISEKSKAEMTANRDSAVIQTVLGLMERARDTRSGESLDFTIEELKALTLLLDQVSRSSVFHGDYERTVTPLLESLQSDVAAKELMRQMEVFWNRRGEELVSITDEAFGYTDDLQIDLVMACQEMEGHWGDLKRFRRYFSKTNLEDICGDFEFDIKELNESDNDDYKGLAVKLGFIGMDFLGNVQPYIQRYIAAEELQQSKGKAG